MGRNYPYLCHFERGELKPVILFYLMRIWVCTCEELKEKKKGLEFNSIKEGAGSKTPTPTYIYVKIPKLKKRGRGGTVLRETLWFSSKERVIVFYFFEQEKRVTWTGERKGAL